MTNRLTKGLIFLLIVFQFMDGAFTIFGISNHGSTEIEGNPLIRYLCDCYGSVPVLIIAKAIAVSVLIFVYKNACKKEDPFLLVILLLPFVAYLYAMFGWFYYFLVIA